MFFPCFCWLKTIPKRSDNPSDHFAPVYPRPLPTHFTSVLHFWIFFEKQMLTFWSIFEVFGIPFSYPRTPSNLVSAERPVVLALQSGWVRMTEWWRISWGESYFFWKFRVFHPVRERTDFSNFHWEWRPLVFPSNDLLRNRDGGFCIDSLGRRSVSGISFVPKIC